jgi:hypothetical protein
MFHFGGEMFVKYESGDVHYQDEFGRTEKPREFLIKKAPQKPLRPGDLCGCGRGRPFEECCQSKPEALRPAWNETSIRERNLMLQNGIVNVLELESGIGLGLVNLIPDPCDFDFHLREQMMSMARARSASMQFEPKNEPRLQKTMEEDSRRGIMLMPPDAMRRQLRKFMPHLDEEHVEAAVRSSVRMRELDPLGVLQEGSMEGGKAGGQMNMFKLVPNFEMTMYLAQATGACVVTDSPFRWTEVQGAIRRRFKAATPGLAALVTDIERSKFAFPQNVTDVVAAALNKTGAGYPDLLRDLFKYLSNLEGRGAKPNREAQFVGRFAKAHAAAQGDFKKSGFPVKEGRISCVFPPGGIQDNRVNRLLLMSSSETHLSNVPIAFLIESAD